MRLDIEHALAEKFAVPTILYIHEKKAIYKYDLKLVTKSQRQIERLVAILKSVGIIWIDDVSNKKRREYRVGLTDLGKIVAENLMKVDEKGEQSRFFLGILQEFLIEIYLSGAKSLVELSQVRYFDEGRKLLLELDEKGLVDIEKLPSGAPNLSSPVSFKITSKGETVAKSLLTARRALETN